jgi:putative N6-adenine-specific DNA methylase
LENKNNQFQMIAKTFKGLEEVLAKELENLGAAEVKILNRAVGFKGDNMMMYKANLWLRTALTILKPINKFKARHDIEIYEGFMKINWEDYFDVQNTFAIDAVVNSQYFNHSQFVALKAKDAIVDQFRNKYNKRPSVDTEKPDIWINIHVSEDECIVSLDSSGESLHKRGYRVNSTIAPINEVLAAGMIMLSDWNGQCDLIDPMCGSGTIPIEAALIAYNIPPGLFRKEFGFEKWKDFDADLFEEVYNDDSSSRDFEYQIYASDISAGAIRIASDNARNASLHNKINFQIISFEGLIPEDENGFIITNPPYGERIKKNNIEDFYKSIGDHLKKNFTGYEAWIISGSKEGIEQIGLHPSKKIALYNGAIECKYQRFVMYSGSKKVKYDKAK